MLRADQTARCSSSVLSAAKKPLAAALSQQVPDRARRSRRGIVWITADRAALDVIPAYPTFDADGVRKRSHQFLDVLHDFPLAANYDFLGYCDGDSDAHSELTAWQVLQCGVLEDALLIAGEDASLPNELHLRPPLESRLQS